MHSRNMLLRGLVISVLAFVAWGCSKANDNAPTIDSSGKHPAGWVTAATGGNHPGAYLNSPDQCFECHGSDLTGNPQTGGIANVSCFAASFAGFACHPDGPLKHPAGFADPSAHGAKAKAALAGVNGFAFCRRCHGADFNGATIRGAASASCLNNALCHGVNNAPHSPKPWLGGVRSHTNTDVTNAAVCAQCHTGGANSARKPSATEEIGATGCFNATLCHGQVGHPEGWANPGQHGAAAKLAPNSNTGMAYCKLCHGADLHGSGSADSCFSAAPCHSNSPHSPPPWRRTVPPITNRTHSATDPGNASVCAGCHLNNQRLTTPVAVPAGTGCFNSTLCHGIVGHPAGWDLPANHGVKARSAPGPESGYDYCRGCHGDGSAQFPLFQGGPALTSCLRTDACHQAASPHPKKPWLGPSLSHTNASEQNAVVCSICHTGGANLTSIPLTKYGPYAAGSPGCFNNTLCHPNLGDCTNCHSRTQGIGRRIIIGADGVAGGDFALASHHVKNFPVKMATCDVCHDQANHKSVDTANGVRVLLTNQDTGAQIAYDGTGASLEPFCVSCHNGNGAAIQPVPFQPFKDSGDVTAPPNINWTVGAMAHSFGNACYNCHGNSAGTANTASGTTNSPRFNGHGSATPKLLQLPFDPAATANTAPANFCYNCHGAIPVGTAPAIQPLFGKARHHTGALCKDCHNQHSAKAGTHTVGSNIAGNAINGSTGAQLTVNPLFFAAPAAANFTARTTVSGTDLEATLCFRCHSAFAGVLPTSASLAAQVPGQTSTDQAQEFNPNNVGNYLTVGTANWDVNIPSPETAGSFHPVLATAGNNLGAIHLTNLTVASGFSRTTRNLMTCSDCHSSDNNTDPSGPHGSAAGFILKGPNTSWNATLTLSTSGMPADTFCANCHDSTFANSRFPAHTNPNHATFFCFDCHSAIPHGSQRPGLLVAPAGVDAGVPPAPVTDIAPYVANPGSASRLRIKSYPGNKATNWGKPNCSGAICH
ncbi:MAG: cytochrome [Geobacteraceae bacterium]|nr:MAG: cytochrome [Geobacteraceae bacterium]